MEFRFNLNELFQEPCVEIGNTLIPPGFTGDKRALWDTQSKVTQIVNAIGEASAHAQGLSKPITTADRLRNSEHRLYLLIDQAANNGKGAVTGMLKTGQKGLYVFDREGQHYQVSPPCVLDFYIHESRQRTGFGRRLFEHMLEKEQLEPNKMAIDRPSDKFLGFLNKHYGLNTPVKQMNNYVVFDGFFPRLAATQNKIPADKSNTPTKRQSANGLQQSYHSSPYGRYAAAHPACSMGEIIHNDSPVINRNQEPTGHNPAQSTTNGGTPSKADRPNSLNIEINDDEELYKLKLHEEHLGHGDSDSFDGDAIDALEEEIRDVEIAPKSPGIEAAGYVTPGRNTPGMKTDQGYYDLKFYHNKLW